MQTLGKKSAHRLQRKDARELSCHSGPVRGTKNGLDEVECGLFYSPFRFCQLLSDDSDDIPIRGGAVTKCGAQTKRA